LTTISLPAESITPFSLGILIVTAMIFIIVVYSTRSLVRSLASKQRLVELANKKKKSVTDNIKGALPAVSPTELSEHTEKSDVIAKVTGIGGLFIAVLGAGIVPLVVFPLLDYSAYTQGTSNVTIAIKNIGFTSAKNVVVSLHATQGGFSNMTTEPYFADQFKKEITSSGDVYGKIANLAPRESANITGIIKPDTDKDVTVTPYVFSDEVVGKVNTLWTVIFYGVLAAVYSVLFLILYFGVEILQVGKTEVIGSILVVVMYVFVYLVLYHVVAVIPTYPHASPAFPI
jgi:hypothetical protein